MCLPETFIICSVIDVVLILHYVVMHFSCLLLSYIHITHISEFSVNFMLWIEIMNRD